MLLTTLPGPRWERACYRALRPKTSSSWKSVRCWRGAMTTGADRCSHMHPTDSARHHALQHWLRQLSWPKDGKVSRQPLHFADWIALILQKSLWTGCWHYPRTLSRSLVSPEGKSSVGWRRASVMTGDPAVPDLEVLVRSIRPTYPAPNEDEVDSTPLSGLGPPTAAECVPPQLVAVCTYSAADTLSATGRPPG